VTDFYFINNSHSPIKITWTHTALKNEHYALLLNKKISMLNIPANLWYSTKRRHSIAMF